MATYACSDIRLMMTSAAPISLPSWEWVAAVAPRHSQSVVCAVCSQTSPILRGWRFHRRGESMSEQLLPGQFLLLWQNLPHRPSGVCHCHLVYSSLLAGNKAFCRRGVDFTRGSEVVAYFSRPGTGSEHFCRSLNLWPACTVEICLNSLGH